MYDYMIYYYTQHDVLKVRVEFVNNATSLRDAVVTFTDLNPTVDVYRVQRVGDLVRGYYGN